MNSSPDRDPLAAAILKSGGLLRYGKLHMQRVSIGEASNDDAPRTLVEKILARHALTTDVTSASLEPGNGIFVRADWRFIHEYYTGMAAHMLHATFGRPLDAARLAKHARVRGSSVVFASQRTACA